MRLQICVDVLRKEIREKNLCQQVFKRFVSVDSLRIKSPLKSVDEEIYNCLSFYKNRKNLNLSVRNNLMPVSLKECDIYEINKNLKFSKCFFEMFEERALNVFHLVKKYWGCIVYDTDMYVNDTDELFLFHLYKGLLKEKGKKVLHIEFSLNKSFLDNNNINNNTTTTNNNNNDNNNDNTYNNDRLEDKKQNEKNLLNIFYNITKVQYTKCPEYEELKTICDSVVPDLVYIDETNNPYSFDYDFLKYIKNKNRNVIIIVNISNKGHFIYENLMMSPFEKSEVDIVFSYFNENFFTYNNYIIYYRKGYKYIDSKGQLQLYDLEEKLKQVFFNDTINTKYFSLATSFQLTQNPEFKNYVQQVKKNTFVLFQNINKKQLYIQYRNSSFFNIQWAIPFFDISEFFFLCSKLHIYFDLLKGAKCKQRSFNLGTNYLTALGLQENDFRTVARFFNASISLYIHLKQNNNLSNEMFQNYVETEAHPDIVSLSTDISCFVNSFPDINIY